MYFTTPKSPNIFLIGIFENQLYGFGKRNRKLSIYQKSIFDVGDWNAFYVFNTNVMSSSICKCSGGLHLASGIIDSKIWIVGKKSWFKTFVYSLDIFSMEIQTFKVAETQNIFVSPLIPCHKCTMPHIRILDSDSLQFLIAPSHVVTKKSTFIQFFILTIDETSQSCFFDYLGDRYITATISSNIAINQRNEILYANRNLSNYGTESFSIVNGRRHFEKRNKHKKWKDIVFFNDGDKIYCFARYLDKNKCVQIGFYFVRFSYRLRRFKFAEQFVFNVDSNFPSLQSSTVFVTANFFVFQACQKILIIPRRMLSLSEYAYISCLQIPEPPKPKLSFFEKIKQLFLKCKRKSKPWMSLNFIIDALKLSPSFSLIHLSCNVSSGEDCYFNKIVSVPLG